MSRAARFFCLLLPLLAAVPATHSDTNDYSGQVRVTLESPLVDDARSGNALGVDEITISWRFWILMGEPVKTFVGTYRTPEAGQQRMRALARVADLDECRNGQVVSRRVPTTVLTNQLPAGTAGGRLQSITLFRAWLAESSSAPTRFSLRREKLFIDFSPDSLMPEHAGVGLSTPGSPEWGELFQRSSLRGGSEYLSADEAKAVFRRGISIDSVEIIRASVDVSALRSAYNNSVRESCEKAEEEKNAKIAERFKRRVEQLVASEEAPEKPEKRNQRILSAAWTTC